MAAKASLCLLGLTLLPQAVLGFKWPIDNTYDKSQYKFTFSELYMYNYEDAPFGLTLFKPDIHMDLHVTLEPDVADLHENYAYSLVAAAFHVPEKHVANLDTLSVNDYLKELASATDLCAQVYDKDKISNLMMHSVALTNKGNETVYESHANMVYEVHNTGIQSVVLEMCYQTSPDSTVKMAVADATVSFQGELTFKNPYGYLSGIYFGYIPFEACRAIIFALFGALYIVVLILKHERVIKVHYFITAVVWMAAIEALGWFMAYVLMNTGGAPYCCPFPPAVVVAMCFEMLRRTLSRALLLIICMGYGIVRESLTMKEIIMVSVLSLSYLVASVLVDVHDIAEINDLGRSTTHSMWWDFPVLVFDLTFLIWIYLSLVNIMGSLRATGQTFKLTMYTKLANTMGVFVIFVSMLTLVIVLAREGTFAWPWQLYWMQTVAWEVLNLAVLVAVAFLWRPTEYSVLLSQSQQLSMNDDENEEEVDIEDDGDMAKRGVAGDFSLEAEGAFDIEMTGMGGMDGDGDEEYDYDQPGPPATDNPMMDEGGAAEEPGNGDYNTLA
mmetsp:Transcript_15921/g.37104  ORF Transcript_15921/g.37104 Transcript_15921/m.37104 type:complete len:555 (-) Transcript_15921:220-1884(-)|eukprot:CAMPEP_0182572088 /NCGR_PEP_ID=MMETSP1324-20130603/15787_1 /TAXON_ID=236786 /ORGANISM="Florenciella sp., Strain RCC1587" /LENGTH=554 /DNA_ID=CAMNT_0024786891 /DNA_START=174 /DNA_END=1838 /DNA_ORIENTATION=-